MTDPANRTIYKITTVQAWDEAVKSGAFAGSADDVRDGFIHLSAAHQVAVTARKYFSGVEGLVLVAVAPDALGPVLKWEPSRGGDLFPHCHGPLPVQAARWVRALPLDSSGVPCLAGLIEPDSSERPT